TQGPPAWVWYATKSSCLNKLKALQPKSGITLTQLALEKYQQQEKSSQEKAQLKKQYKKLRDTADQDAKQPKHKTAIDPDLGFTYLVVEAKERSFIWTPPKHTPPATVCIVCEGGLYALDYRSEEHT